MNGGRVRNPVSGESRLKIMTCSQWKDCNTKTNKMSFSFQMVDKTERELSRQNCGECPKCVGESWLNEISLLINS